MVGVDLRVANEEISADHLTLMNMPTEAAGVIASKRPVMVWVISIFYLFGSGFSLLSFLLVFAGLIPVTAGQAAYFRSLDIFDVIASIFIGGMSLGGAVLLFVLKKAAVRLFVPALALALAQTIYHVAAKNWLGAITAAGLAGAITGWGINFGVIIYTKRLISRGVLK